MRYKTIFQLQLAGIFIFFYLSSVQVQAGAFQINMSGQKQIGMGHTGVALPLDASAVYFNPGAMTFVRHRSFVGGATIADIRVRYLDDVSGASNTNEFNRAFPFFVYADWQPDTTSNWKAGLGLYMPYGSSLKWPDDWAGRYSLREIQLRTFYLQPTFSYRITPQLGLGAGLVMGRGNVLIRRAIPLSSEDLPDGEVKLTGDAIGLGFNAGVFYELNESVRFGVAYLSSVKVQPDEGLAEFTVPALLKDSFPDGNISTRLRLPFSFTGGVSVSPHQNTNINFDVQYTGWSSYDSLIIDFEQNTDVLEDTREPRLYQNNLTFRIGGEHHFNDRLAIRAGTFLDLSPVQDGYLSPETPDADKLGITFGAGYTFSDFLHFDFSFQYIHGTERLEKTSENFNGLGGTYKGTGVTFGLGVQILY